VDDEELAAFYRQFRTFLHEVMARPPELPRSTLLQRLEHHLGVDPVGLPVVAEWFPPFNHANIYLALEAYAAGDGRAAELVGVGGHGREHQSLSEILESATHGAYPLGSVDYASVAVGPGVERTVVNFGLYLVSDGPDRLAVLLRGGSQRHGRPMAGLEVIGESPAAAQRLLTGVRELSVANNIFRGQVVSFEPHEFDDGVGPVRFHRRPTLDASDVVLPPGALAAVERQVIGVARHRDRLRAAGHPLKRGVLLFGPPGTGKTHTVRYLLAQLPEFTAVLLSGTALAFIQPACALARLVQPALVVLEDVDLIAQSRDFRHGMDNPLLYQVLNEMDGLGGDADVAFLLTTNRPDLLEAALADRPGRVDLVVEVPLPSAPARASLLALYGAGLALTDDERASVVADTEGMTASFFAELARRATLLAAVAGEEPGGAHVRAALEELRANREVLAHRAVVGR
jgi:cell division protease FtsH